MEWKKAFLAVGVSVAVCAVQAPGMAQDEDSAPGEKDETITPGGSAGSSAGDGRGKLSKERLRSILQRLKKQGVTDVLSASYYIDKASGSSNGSGSIFDPLEYIADLPSLSDDDVVGFKHGNRWRESFRHGNVRTGGYGDLDDHELAIIDASDVVTSTWNTSEDREDANENVYSLTWHHEEGGSHLPLAEDGTRMLNVGSVSQCDSTPGSYFVNVGEDDTSNTVYYHPTNSTDANNDDKTVEIAKRNLSLVINDRASEIHTRMQVGSNGSLSLGQNVELRQILATNGHKHNAIGKGDSFIKDSVFWGAHDTKPNHEPGGTLYVDFGPNFDGRATEFERCGFVENSDRVQSPVNAYVTHTPDGSSLDKITWNKCWVHGTKIGFQAGPPVFVYNCYADSVRHPRGREIRRTLIRQTHGDGVQRPPPPFYKNVGLHTGSTSNKPIWQHRGNALHFTVEDSMIYSDGRTLLDDTGSTADRGTFRIRNSVIVHHDGASFRGISISNQTVDMDYNIYAGPYSHGNQFHLVADGTTYTDLGNWQEASGVDQNSVYVTGKQFETLFLGNPQEGDFRINPNARVTAGDGTVYTGQFPDGTPLNEAGIQKHYDWNRDKVVQGPPLRWPNVPTSKEEVKRFVQHPNDYPF